MLTTLHIENIAVIERADVEFTDGLNVLTGETGAGKSIVIDALNAVLGGRTSREIVRSGEDKALVTAVFSGKTADNWCAENGIELEDELILQRRVTADGKSNCRVCGVPVTAQQLRELGVLLLDIHGQNDGRRLMDEATHRDFLDGFGGHSAQMSDFAQAYDGYHKTKAEIKRLSMDDLEKARIVENLNFQISEIEGANLRGGERDELEARRVLLKNAGKLTEALDDAYDALYTADESALSQVASAGNSLSRISELTPEAQTTELTITDARFMLEDAAERIRDLRATLDFSETEYDTIESRLAELRRLEKKYSKDESELLEHLENCRERLGEIEYAGDTLKKLEAKLAIDEKVVRQAGERLTAARKIAAQELERRIVGELRELNMPAVRFQVNITKISSGFDASGADEICFLMSANAGENLGKISKIASGGELSRIMLAMKNVFAERDNVPSLVFDEVDAGVSGVAAQRVGEKLASLSRHKQVLCVTHLPQIAAMADTHFVVEKSESAGRTHTRLTLLDKNGRILELARLHGGENVTETTLKSAGEQLSSAQKFKEDLGNST